MLILICLVVTLFQDYFKGNTNIMMIIRHKYTGRTSCFNFAKNEDFKLGDLIFVKFQEKDKLGKIIFIDNKLEKNIPVLQIKDLRKPSKREIDALRLIDRKKRLFKNEFLRKVARYRLCVKLLDIKYHLAKRHVTFVIKANEGEANLKKLKDNLTYSLNCNVELKQISPRSETRYIGGLGICGRQLCCAGFLKGFQAVSIKMVKDQHLSMNPARISGACGKLLCCLAYEEDNYKDQNKIKLELDPSFLLEKCKQKDESKKNNLPLFY